MDGQKPVRKSRVFEPSFLYNFDNWQREKVKSKRTGKCSGRTTEVQQTDVGKCRKISMERSKKDEKNKEQKTATKKIEKEKTGQVKIARKYNEN